MATGLVGTVVSLGSSDMPLSSRCERYQIRPKVDGVRSKKCPVLNGVLENEVGGGGLSHDFTPKMGGCYMLCRGGVNGQKRCLHTKSRLVTETRQLQK